jgi:hypothetical protein
MIKKIREQFHNQKEKSLEKFLLDNKDKIQAEYMQPELLLFLNFTEILKEEKVFSEKIENEFKKLLEENNLEV